MRALGYLRVSTAEQGDSGAGIDAQRAAIAIEAARRGWEVEFIEDRGYSARSMKRPGLTTALARLKQREVGTLVVAKMDRLSRSLLDYSTIMQGAQREGWALVALDSPADFTTASGEAMAGVMAVFAQLERRLVSERTKAALAQRKAAGVRLGRERVIPGHVEARVHALRSEGMTIRRIGATLELEGHKAPGGGSWRPSTIHRVLNRA
jgi:DNA invertase Pin-like site-specific DNA recombinase